MSMSLVVLLPIVMLGIVGMFCFAGCAFHTGGLQGPPFTSYTGTTILANSPNCIAYWPLKEAVDTLPASELISNNTGNYIDPNTAPDLYPWNSYMIANGANPDVLSAAAADMDADKIALAQPGIVLGDVDLLPGDTVPPACMVVNGAYVEVPWKDKFIPKTSFTVEAWVRVDWIDGDPHAWRFVLDMRERNPVTAGFAIYAKADDNAPGYRWAAILGNGTAGFTFLDNTELPITLKGPGDDAGPIVYLVLTYESVSRVLTLFVNGEKAGEITSDYTPNTTQPLWIGAGAPYVPRRTQPVGPEATSPLFPFFGAIQDVAIYSVVLDPVTMNTHFRNGGGLS